MRSRRWVIGGLAAAAALLVAGRLLAGWYVDYTWFDALGAGAVWRVRFVNLLLLRSGAFAVATLFVLANLFAVRFSVVSLILPRRVGNIEIGEEVPGRMLNGIVLALSVGLGLLLALSQRDWRSLELVRHGLAFRESDPYFQFDLAFWVYWLPLESSLHLWSLITHLSVSLIIVVLYALTPSLRWEGGRLRVSGYVRRHFITLGALLLLLLAWSYRLDAHYLLLEGSGAKGAFNALDHRVGIPASLFLALSTVVAAMLLLWAGWMGQLRLAFVTVSAALLLALTLRQFVPPIANRMLTPADPEARNVPYTNTRVGYTRRAFDVDRVDRSDSATTNASLATALRGASIWDASALARAVDHDRHGALMTGAPGWEMAGGRLRATFIERSTAPGADDARAEWRLVRVEADVTDGQGRPAATTSDGAPTLLIPASVDPDSAPAVLLVADSGGGIAAPSLASLPQRIALAWGLQNPRILGEDISPQRARVVLNRDVRRRVRRLYPFFTQGLDVSPLVLGDSLHWTLHLYATSEHYPLSDPMDVGDDEVRYFRHAGVAVVNAHSGRVFVVSDPDPDPIAASWMRRFPSLFVAPSALDRDLVHRVVPPVEAAIVQARIFAQSGPRGERSPASHLPRQLGGDTLFSAPSLAPFLDSLSGALALGFPVLDASDRVRGLVVAAGGAEYAPRWVPFADAGTRWSSIVDRLHRALDSAAATVTPRDAPLVRGPIRVIPYERAGAYVQTAYAWRGDGGPTARLVAVLVRDSARTGATIVEAAGLPAPALSEEPLAPEDFRARLEALYAEMREALRRGDWSAFGAAFDAAGRLFRIPAAKP